MTPHLHTTSQWRRVADLERSPVKIILDARDDFAAGYSTRILGEFFSAMSEHRVAEEGSVTVAAAIPHQLGRESVAKRKKGILPAAMIVAGSLSRRNWANQSPVPTPGAVTPPAAQAARQPPARHI